MKVLMMDKEKSEMDRIAKIVKRNLENAEIYRVGTDRKNKIAYIKEKSPEVVIVGQENENESLDHMIWQIHSSCPKAYILVYTKGNKDNGEENIKKMMESKVYRYIFCPMNKRILVPILNNISEQLDREKQAVELSDQYKQLLTQGKEALEFSFIYYTLFDIGTKDKLTYFTKMFKINNLGYVIAIRYNENDEVNQIPYEEYSRVISQYTPYGYRCIIGPKMARQIIILVMETKENTLDDRSKKMQQIKFASAIRKYFINDIRTNVEIGIGCEREVSSLTLSYEEALRSMRYEKVNEISHIEDIELGKRMKRQQYIELETKLLAATRSGEPDVFTIFTSMLSILDEYRIEDKKNKIVELFVLIAHEVRNNGPSTVDFISYTDMAKEVNEVNPLNLNAWAFQYLNHIVNGIRECQEEQSVVLIKKTLKYMEEHFAEELSLQEISRLANVSPQYFSRLFREKMDMTFVDYLTKLRINKAVEWLKYSDKNIQEVCYGVGYKDPNYFSRVFKKSTGYSPKEYIAKRSK